MAAQPAEQPLAIGGNNNKRMHFSMAEIQQSRQLISDE
jgi:hypothetical protein